MGMFLFHENMFHIIYVTFLLFLLNQLKSLEKLCFTPHLNYAIVKYDPGLVLADVKTPVLELHHYKEEISRFDRIQLSFEIGHR